MPRVLNLRIQVSKGPRYRFGDLRLTGLAPNLEARDRWVWKVKPGDPYDYGYANEFFQAFSRSVDLRDLRNFKPVAQKRSGDPVMDVNVVFEAR